MYHGMQGLVTALETEGKATAFKAAHNGAIPQLLHDIGEEDPTPPPPPPAEPTAQFQGHAPAATETPPTDNIDKHLSAGNNRPLKEINVLDTDMAARSEPAEGAHTVQGDTGCM